MKKNKFIEGGAIMKYIRTKDGIYDLDKSIWYEFTGRKVRMPYCEEYEKQPELCKTADTIEELCDEFRVRDNDNYSTYEIDITCRNLQELYEELQIQNQTLFGAIWTNKGLIYVAKMNEKGELELL